MSEPRRSERADWAGRPGRWGRSNLLWTEGDIGASDLAAGWALLPDIFKNDKDLCWWWNDAFVWDRLILEAQTRMSVMGTHGIGHWAGPFPPIRPYGLVARNDDGLPQHCILLTPEWNNLTEVFTVPEAAVAIIGHTDAIDAL